MGTSCIACVMKMCCPQNSHTLTCYASSIGFQNSHFGFHKSLNYTHQGLFIFWIFAGGVYSKVHLKIFLLVGHFPVEIFLLINYFFDATYTSTKMFLKGKGNFC